MKVDGETLKKYILSYLEKNRLMSLATSDGSKPWVSTVFFAYDTDLNIYFISVPNTRKITNLTKNPQVAIVINQSQPAGELVQGLQIEGKAEKLDKEEEKEELEIYRKRYGWADDYLHDHELYKIKPEKVYYLDDEKFGAGGREELEL